MNIKFQSVKAQISSFERVPVEISKISQLNLGKHILTPLETLASFFKNKHVKNYVIGKGKLQYLHLQLGIA